MAVAVIWCSEYVAFTPACGSAATLRINGVVGEGVKRVVLRGERSIR